jgi:DNA segregation ATPase FtsK/SpoIIIE, S-DNA-T family
MRLTLTVVDPVAGVSVDLVIDADPATPVGSLMPALARSVSPGPLPPLYVAGRPLEPDVAFAASPLLEGVVVSVGAPAGCLPTEPPGVAEARVVGGPGAGVVHRLGPGEFTIGRDPSCALRLLDGAAPGRAAHITVGVDGSVTIDPDPEPDAPGTADRRVTIGGTVLEIGMPTVPDAALARSEDGAGLDVNRPPRLLPPARRTRFSLPLEPVAPDRQRLPIGATLLPVGAAIAMAYVFKQVPYLLFALLGPLTVVASHVHGRRQGARAHRTRLAAHLRARAEIEEAARSAVADERAARRALCPDPAAVLLVAVGPRRRLWERRRGDPDHLLLRLGTGDLPSEVFRDDPNVAEHRRETTWPLPDVPVAVSLRDRGVLGVAGPGGLPRVIGCWLVAQAAVLHSPRDLAICVLTDGAGRGWWEWVRWLPHARPTERQEAVVSLGSDADGWGRHVGELCRQIAARASARLSGVAGSSGVGAPDVLVVLDGARRLRSQPGVVTLLRDGPPLGIHVVCLDGEDRFLPEECQAVAAFGPDGNLRVTQMHADPVPGVRPDLVATTGPDPDLRATVSWCERVARSLAPLRDVGPGDDAALPSSARLVDVLGAAPPTGPAIAARWSRAGPSTEAVVGVSLDGTFALDLRRDGPHGLIAGTTGAGKSELLRAIVASLAVANRPDAMTFVLVDYKGGSAFAQCADLPHTVGMVTDLDPHLVERALTSLSAELRRRERLLATAGTHDIDAYLQLAANGEAEPLPRLLIVIDEFASMARELPDFVTGLVDLAQRGRSLGMHLLLATQRPSGVVSPEIRANTNLRIALRVTDTSDSTDILDAPDAAWISAATPGRGYARLGHGSPVPFQAGRVGGPAHGGAAGGGPAGGGTRPPSLTAADWTAPGRPALRPPGTAGPGGMTDLGMLVDAVRAAAATLEVPPQRGPWLRPLPDVVTVDALPPAAPPPAATPGATDVLAPVPLGLSDFCDRQAQLPFTVDLERGGHLLIVGAARSGRSTALRTFAGTVAATLPVSAAHVYGLDCGNGALLPLTALPHCGAVVTRDQPDRVGRLFTRLLREVARRQEMFAARGFADLAEQRAAERGAGRWDAALPYLLLLVDRFEGFLASFEDVDGGTLVETLPRLLREGQATGLRVVVTSDGHGLTGRLASAIEHRFVLRLTDRADYGLAGVPPKAVPDVMPAGRGFRVAGAVETQLALLAPDPSGPAQVAALHTLARAATRRHLAEPVGGAQVAPFRIDALPARVTVADVEALRVGPAPSEPMRALLGVGGDELRPVEVDLAAVGPGFVVAGPPRSGRSHTLVTMARSLATRGARLLIVAPRPSPLTALEGTRGVIALLDRSAGPGEMVTAMAGDGAGRPLVVVVDDAELLTDTPLADALSDIDIVGALIAAGTTDDLLKAYRGFTVDIRRSRSGLLLAPSSALDGDLLGVRLPRGAVGGSAPPGRGLLVSRGQVTPVQVALP